MGTNPINLALRFLLELVTLFLLGFWGWKQNDGVIKFVFAIGIPIIAATIWGVFAVPQDPSRSGASPVPTPGIVRLFIELIFFASATWVLFNTGYKSIGWIFASIVLLHYVFSYDRIMWLIDH